MESVSSSEEPELPNPKVGGKGTVILLVTVYLQK